MSKDKKKLLNILKTAKEATPTSKKRKRSENEPKSILKHKNIADTDPQSGKHITFAVEDVEDENMLENTDDSDDDQADQENPQETEEVDENAKRGITYQIAKNKGLMPTRKKEQRNPRVKHRNKFRKAKIRRKGAVREVRHELSRYGGEISGIKASVSKSVKLKS